MQLPLVDLRNVDVAVEGHTILHKLSWQLFPGQHWAIAGSNGSGKSTFLRLIRGDLWPAPGRGTRIYRLEGGKQTTAVKVKEQVSIVSPEMHDRYLQQEWQLMARHVIESGFLNGDYVYRRLTRDQDAIVAEVSGLMGIRELWQRNVQQLSTGELRKVLIARALVGRPRILALDEACDGLDRPSRTDLLSRLDRVGRNGTQIVFATHRSEEVLPCIGHFLTLERGRIANTAPKSEQDGEAQASTLQRPSKGFRSSRPASEPSTKARTLLRISGADVFLERRKILKNIDWEIRSDQNWAVFGANGAGKTTLLKLAFGDVYAAWGGKVSRFEFTSRDTIWQLRQKVGIVSPELQANYRRPVSGEEVVASGFFETIGLHDPLSRRQRDQVSTLLRSFSMSELAPKSALEMSYGELRKMLLLRAVVHEPELLICDEPFDGLDARSKAEFSTMLERIAQGNTRLIVVTHHVGDLPHSITHGLLLEHGQIVKQGRIAGLVQHPLTRRFFEAV